GLTLQQPGYNVYIAGPVGTGRTTYARKKVQAVAAAKPVPPDWCYVYNFQQPDQPAALSPPAGAGAKFRKDIDELIEELKDAMRELEQRAVSSAAAHPITRLKERYADHPKIGAYLDQILADVVEHLDDFKEQEEPAAPFPLAALMRRQEPFTRYRVNLVVDNSHLRGAPVIEESNPTYYNLLGKVEYRGEFGALVTDFTMIKCGALQQANGGFLTLQVRDVLANPLSWEALKRALKSGEARIENIGEQLGLMPTATLRPEPIPLDVKVLLIGTPQIFQLL